MMPRFGQEQVQELIATLSANKLRTVLTGFAVGWGVLILVLLLSSGMGIANGIRKTAADLGLSSAKANLDVGLLVFQPMDTESGRILNLLGLWYSSFKRPTLKIFC